MAEGGFTDAFLDSEYLKLDEGALAFIFTRGRIEAAKALSEEEALALVDANRETLVKLYARATERILREAFYMDLFEELSELEDGIAFAFMNLALGRVQDAEVEAARVKVVAAYQAKRKRPSS